MDQNTIIFFCLVFAFIVFITMRGELGTYIQLIL